MLFPFAWKWKLIQFQYILIENCVFIAIKHNPNASKISITYIYFSFVDSVPETFCSPLSWLSPGGLP